VNRCVERNELAADAEDILVTKPPGYLFRIDPAQVDGSRFQRLHRYGQEQLRRREYGEAARSFRAALELWAGPPLANVPCGPVLTAYSVELLKQRRSALHLRIEAEIGTCDELQLLHRELLCESEPRS
jgi:hypothetical protein